MKKKSFSYQILIYHSFTKHIISQRITTFNKPLNHHGEMLLLKMYSTFVKCFTTCYCLFVMNRWRVECSIVDFKPLGSLESDFLVCVGSLFLSSQRL